MVLQIFNQYGHVQMKLGHMAHRGKLPLLEAGNDRSEWKNTAGVDWRSIGAFSFSLIIIV